MFLLLAILYLFPQSAAPAQADCNSREECRAQALIAEAAGDFEHFHDLAWRAVQKGKPNDPELMQMLARAMARSGRPGDAIVMLGRVVDLGVKPDVSGEEFAVVRTLKDWPELEAKIAAMPSAAAAPAERTAPPEPAAPPSKSRPAPRRSAPVEAPAEPAAKLPAAPSPKTEPKEKPAERSEPKTADVDKAPVEVTAGEPAAEVLEFDAPAVKPSGLAYDAVSKRFVVADRTAGKLIVIDERSRHVVTLVGAASAGFYDDLAAFTIDPRRGDLWVVSSRADDEGRASRLHKIQLVSGRTIFEVDAGSFGDVQLSDVAVSPGGVVYALDEDGGRVLRVRPGSRALELAAKLKTDAPRAIAAPDDRTVYIASPDGIACVDLQTQQSATMQSKEPLTGVTALAVNGRTLFALRSTDGGTELIRARLDQSGRRALSVQRIDAATAVSVTPERVYYIAGPGVIRSVPAK